MYLHPTISSPRIHTTSSQMYLIGCVTVTILTCPKLLVIFPLKTFLFQCFLSQEMVLPFCPVVQATNFGILKWYHYLVTTFFFSLSLFFICCVRHSMGLSVWRLASSFSLGKFFSTITIPLSTVPYFLYCCLPELWLIWMLKFLDLPAHLFLLIDINSWLLSAVYFLSFVPSTKICLNCHLLVQDLNWFILFLGFGCLCLLSLVPLFIVCFWRYCSS